MRENFSYNILKIPYVIYDVKVVFYSLSYDMHHGKGSKTTGGKGFMEMGSDLFF